MDSNTHSNQSSGSPQRLRSPGSPERPEPLGPPGPSALSGSLESLEWSGPLEGLEDVAELTVMAGKLATRDLGRLPVLARTQRVLALQQVASRLHAQWLKELADLDALGAAGADPDQPAPSTAAWLRNRLRMGWGRQAAAFGPPGPCLVAHSKRPQPP